MGQRSRHVIDGLAPNEDESLVRQPGEEHFPDFPLTPNPELNKAEHGEAGQATEELQES